MDFHMQPKNFKGPSRLRQVWERVSPLALLSVLAKAPKRQRAGALPDAGAFTGRSGLPLAAALMFLALGLIPAPAQSSEQLMQLMMSQPRPDISGPVTAVASFDPPVVRPGEKSIYRVTFNATSDAAAVAIRWPEPMPAPAPLKLHLVASGHDMQPVPGVPGGMQMFSTFNFDAQSAVPGMFTVPAFTVDVYGKPVVVPAAQLVVQTEVPQPHEPARHLILEVATTNLYVGQTMDVRVMLPGNSENRIEGMSQVELTGDGFIMNRNAVRQSIQMLERNGRKVPTFIYETTITPITAGKLTLLAQGYTSGMHFGGPVTITGRVTIPGGPPQYTLLNSEPLVLQVRPLPPGNELPGFTGAVGDYSCDPVSLDTNKAEVGGILQLKLVIRGSHHLEQLTPPPPPHVADWQIFPAVRGNLVPGKNGPGASFTYTLMPLTTNIAATPAIPFCSFDPARGEYVDLTIPPVPVTILPGATNADPALMLSENAAGPEVPADLSGLAATPGHAVGSLVPLQLRAWFPLVQLLPVLGLGGLWFWDRRRRYLEAHPDIVRRRAARRALHSELRRLEQAAAAGDDRRFIQCGVQALQIVSAPHYPAAPQALVCGDVLPILSATGLPANAGETVRRFFAAADASAFAPAAGARVNLLAEKSALKEILLKLEARL